MRASLLLPLHMMLFVGVASPAAEESPYVPSHGETAVRQPSSHQEVFPLVAGHPYVVLKHGGPAGAWCKLRPPDGGEPGWVLCAPAGSSKPGVQREATASPGRERSGRTSGACATSCGHPPLFPVQPPLTPGAREILGICPARPDASVAEADVRRFFTDHYADTRLQRALSQAGRPGDRSANIEWLTHLWVGSGPRNAFTHVFCGDDWGKEAIGGLHYLPRYAQLEHDGKVCYDGPAGESGEHPGPNEPYTIRFHALEPWSCGVKRKGGFLQGQDPVELVAFATRAFVHCCNRKAPVDKDGGIFRANEFGGSAFQIFCGTRNGTYGIATFYPVDAPPTCGDAR